MPEVSDDEIHAIIDAGRSDPGERVRAVADNGDAQFTWDYERTRPQMVRLYEKAKSSQWNATTELPWDTDVDQEKIAIELGAASMAVRFSGVPELKNWTEKEWIQFSIESQNNSLSQIMHGEQGALICTSSIIERVPWIDAKYYAATQVVDEARHVEVFSRYLDEKLSGHYPISSPIRSLLEGILGDPRWDITYLGMQIVIEGMALAYFGAAHHAVQEPLLRRLLRYVMSDEARHVAFGVLSLQELYADMTEAELKERQEFLYEACLFNRDRSFQPDVWERMGVDPKPIVRLTLEQPPAAERMYQSFLYSKIVPNCKKLGLLDANKGWLRERFTELGAIAFENVVDTTMDYEQFDEVEKDRLAAASVA